MKPMDILVTRLVLPLLVMTNARQNSNAGLGHLHIRTLVSTLQRQ